MKTARRSKDAQLPKKPKAVDLDDDFDLEPEEAPKRRKKAMRVGSKPAKAAPAPEPVKRGRKKTKPAPAPEPEPVKRRKKKTKLALVPETPPAPAKQKRKAAAPSVDPKIYRIADLNPKDFQGKTGSITMPNGQRIEGLEFMNALGEGFLLQKISETDNCRILAYVLNGSCFMVSEKFTQIDPPRPKEVVEGKKKKPAPVIEDEGVEDDDLDLSDDDDEVEEDGVAEEDDDLDLSDDDADDVLEDDDDEALVKGATLDEDDDLDLDDDEDDDDVADDEIDVEDSDDEDVDAEDTDDDDWEDDEF